MVFQMKLYAVFTVSVLLSSVSVAHADNSNVFNNAVNARDAETKSLAAFNDVDSRDGSGRFNADDSFSQKTEDNLTTAHQTVLANPANGSTYRDQVNAQQLNQKIADADAAMANKDKIDAAVRAHSGVNGNSMANTHQQQAQQSAASASASQTPANVAQVAAQNAKTAAQQSAQVTGITAGQQAAQAVATAQAGNPNNITGTNYRQSVITAQTKVMSVGISTPVDNVPSTVTNIPGKVVSIPFVTVRGGNNEHTSNSHNDHGTGNGSNNAANSNSAHGLGGGDHIGGGRSGGGYHY